MVSLIMLYRRWRFEVEHNIMLKHRHAFEVVNSPSLEILT